MKTKEKKIEFNKGYYTFRFEFTDKNSERRFDINSINDAVPMDIAYDMVRRHITEFEDGKIVWFVENESIKILLSLQKQEIVEEIERIINDDDKDSIRIDDTPSYIRIDARERLFNLKTHINQILTK